MTENIVKVRDDRMPIIFKLSEKDGDVKIFELSEGQNVNWCTEGTFTEMNLRGRIEPWLTSLFQSEHFSLLVGSGLTTAIQLGACGSANSGMGEFTPLSHYSAEIRERAYVSAKETGRGEEPNIEDYIRVMNELLRGLEIIKEQELYLELNLIYNFTKNISKIENQIALADNDKRVEAFNKLVLFLMSFASRTGTRERLNIFTTNYDRMIEAGADIAGLHLIDRFVGSLSPIFRSSRLDIDMHYNPPGIRGEPRYLEGVARYTKLHGSIDWINSNGTIRKIGLPFGAKDITPYLEAPGLLADSSKIMIYPNSAKDRETVEYPYVELFRDFAAALCRPNSTIVTYGYGFGDDHINRIIHDMLTIPSTHLVVIAYGDSMDRIKRCYEEWGRSTQMSLLIGKDVANIDSLVNYYLPKPVIDRNTIRMAEILRQRYEQPIITKDLDEGGTEE